MSIRKAMAYDVCYKESKDLKDTQVQTFIVSAKNPRGPLHGKCGYQPGDVPGVWKSEIPGFRKVPLILLNDLEDNEHNLAFKLFASRRKQLDNAFNRFKYHRPAWAGIEIRSMAAALHEIYFNKESELMSKEITRESFESMKKSFHNALDFMDQDEVLAHYTEEERVSGVSAKARLKGIPADEVLQGMSNQERLRGIPADDRLHGLSKAEREQLFSLLLAEKNASQ